MAPLKESMVLLPLTYIVLLDLVAGKVNTLLEITLVSVLIGGIATVILVSTNILGSGINAAGSIMLFVLLFGAVFYGVSVGVLAIGGTVPQYGPGGSSGWGPIVHQVNGTNAFNPNSGNLNQPVSISYPYEPIVNSLFGIIYALGLYLLIASRGGD